MFSSVFLFFDVGGGEIILIMLVALLLFGGEKLPELARGLGKGIRDFKDASEGVKREITNHIDNFEAKKAEQAAANNTDEKPVAADESLIVANEAVQPAEPAERTMPVAEIGSAAEVEPVTNTIAKPGRSKKTAVEPQGDAPAKTAQKEYKS